MWLVGRSHLEHGEKEWLSAGGRHCIHDRSLLCISLTKVENERKKKFQTPTKKTFYSLSRFLIFSFAGKIFIFWCNSILEQASMS